MKNNLNGYVGQTDRHELKLNKQYLACDRQTDMKKNCVRGVFSKNIWEGATK
jgi:hypothetical protein